MALEWDSKRGHPKGWWKGTDEMNDAWEKRLKKKERELDAKLARKKKAEEKEKLKIATYKAREKERQKLIKQIEKEQRERIKQEEKEQRRQERQEYLSNLQQMTRIENKRKEQQNEIARLQQIIQIERSYLGGKVQQEEKINNNDSDFSRKRGKGCLLSAIGLFLTLFGIILLMF